MENHDGANRDDLNNKPAPAAEQTPPPEEEAPLTFRQWLTANAPTLTILFALFALLFWKFDGDGLLAIGKAALGLSFVIFIHELGHYLAAKWCDVHVTAFSIGFGPALPGCSYKWGETTYKLSLLPLGGYVQMVGQVDGDEASDGSEEDPRSFRNKTVGQRMLIISAGVIMNAILAVIAFIIVYRGPGVDRPAGVIATVDAGAPAFVHGLRTESVILQIGDKENPNFEDLMVWVMATVDGEKVLFRARRPGDERILDEKIEPRLGKYDLKPMIGLAPSPRLQLATRGLVDPAAKHPVLPGSAADAMATPFEFGDKIIAMTDPATGQVTDLPDDPRFPGHGQRDFFEYWRRMSRLAETAKAVTIRVERQDGQHDLKVPMAYNWTLGLRMKMGKITAVRQKSPAAEAGVRPPDPVKKLEGDEIIKVEVVEADGKTPKEWVGPKLDPERLPYELRQWADRMEKADAKKPWQVKVEVRRHSSDSVKQYETPPPLVLAWDHDWRYDRILAMNVAAPMPIPELGLAYQIQAVVDDLDDRHTPDSRLKPNDAIKEIKFVSVGLEGEEIKSKWFELEADQWAFIAHSFLQSPASLKSISFKVKRDGKIVEIEDVIPQVDKSWPSPEQGLVFLQDVRRKRADSILQAVAFGFQDTWHKMVQVVQNLRGMITGRLSIRNLQGPISIARISYKIAGYDLWEFIFFLGLISINLAVINFLPIPVLDGGHMVFLLYEKLRGKPASEGIRIGATYAGLALILCLMVFVIYLDITRLF